MKITYSYSKNEWDEYPRLVQTLIREYNACRICDVGGGANPVLPLDFIDQYQLDCTILDISREELEKAPQGYRKLVQDIQASDCTQLETFDLVFTKMLAEHLQNGKLFHRNIFAMLKPGGIAIHYFPTLYALPFLVNKLVPDRLSSFLLDTFLPRDRRQLGKFPAYYSWCYGPVPAMLRMLAEIGFETVEYRAFFGSTYYSRIPAVRSLHKAYSRYLARHPNPYLTSFAQVILRKPEKSLVQRQPA